MASRIQKVSQQTLSSALVPSETGFVRTVREQRIVVVTDAVQARFDAKTGRILLFEANLDPQDQPSGMAFLRRFDFDEAEAEAIHGALGRALEQMRAARAVTEAAPADGSSSCT